MARTLSEEQATPNHQIDTKSVGDFFKRLDNLHEEFEARAGEFRADVKALYAEASDKLGTTRKIVRHAYQARRAAEKMTAREAEFEESERESLELIRAALGEFADTPLGQAALA